MKTVSFQTLGCRLNHSETEALARSLIQQGWEVVGASEPADLHVVNTCTVTEQSDAKNRQAVRSWRRRNPEGDVVVVGCHAQMAPDELAALEGVRLVLGNSEKLRLAEFLPRALEQEAPWVVREKLPRQVFEAPVVPLPESPMREPRTASAQVLRTRASLKIQDGCDFMCSFCIIPFARGRSRYRSFENLQEEARLLVAQEGVRELVLTGVNIGTYQESGKALLDVIAFLQELPELQRIRISSIEPTTVPEEVFDLMADPQHKLTPFFHLPLQSGSERILQEMKRRYTPWDYAEEVWRACERVPDLYVGADVMVGFPGETEEDFEDTCRLLAELPIHSFHVFPFSGREGTPAFRREDQVPAEVKQQRGEVLRALSQHKRQRFQQRFLGKTEEVLLETPKPDGSLGGFTRHYVRVTLPEAPRQLSNQMVPVELIESGASGMRGQLALPG
ncbi:MAG: tRNA (N(6)-L-threonylcarbamoyladenosine(37)-C(2))-methylthiotransferase MtaB [bacterium]